MNKNSCQISVIIPVYKVEKYIKQCLISVFTQTKTDCVEFIIIDDATPDSSMEIALEVIQKYDDLNIRIVRQNNNSGISAVRQLGLDLANGEYILYIDSDDYCDNNMLEELYRVAKKDNADIVACDFYVTSYSNTCQTDTYIKQPMPCNGQNAIRSLLLAETDGFLWNKFTRRALYNNGGIKFPVDMHVWEDLNVVCKLCTCANIISYHPKAYLHYRRIDEENREIIRKRYDNFSVRVCSFKLFISDFEEYLHKHNIFDRFKTEIMFYKLSFKNIMYVNGGKYQQESLQLFPDTHKYLFSHPSLSIKSKILYFLAIKGFINISNMLITMHNKVK